MRAANDIGASFVLILGDDELKKNTISVKNMDSGAQKEIKQGEIITELMGKG